MFEKILVPTDFTQEADLVLGFVAGMRVLGVKEVVLAHVMDVGASPSWPASPNIMQTLESRLAERQRRLEDAGFSARSELLEGNPPTEILRLADEGGFSLIVSGSHGKLRMEELFFGSVSEAVARRSKTPVLLINYNTFKRMGGARIPAEFATRLLKRVLFPSDFTEASEGALEEMLRLSRNGLDQVVTLHVVDSRRMETETEDREQTDACYKDCARIADRLGAENVSVETRCEPGDPTERIMSVAADVDATLVVLGTHGKGLVREWLDGSVSLDVVRNIDRPVMVVRS